MVELNLMGLTSRVQQVLDGVKGIHKVTAEWRKDLKVFDVNIEVEGEYVDRVYALAEEIGVQVELV